MVWLTKLGVVLPVPKISFINLATMGVVKYTRSPTPQTKILYETVNYPSQRCNYIGS